MNEFFFWNNWKKSDKYIYLSILAVFLAAFIWLIFTFSGGVKNLISWETVSEPHNLSVNAESFEKDLFNYDLNLENYLVVQHFVPSAYKVDFFSSHVYFVFLIIALIAFATALTYARKILYYSILMTFLIAWIVLMKLDVHAIFGEGNQYYSFFVIILYLGATYWAYTTPALRLWQRLGLNTIVTAIWVGILLALSGVSSPILHLTNFGIIFPAILTLLFFLLVGYEIIRLFIFMISYSKSDNGNNNIYNLLIISFLYLGNLALMYMNEQGFISWELVYLNPFILLFISTIIGFWGNKVRSSFSSGFITFAPGGALLYLAWATLAISTLGYSFASYNTSFIRVFEEGIIYSHLAMGVSFLIYILSNFLHLFKQNMPVYKRMYDSINLPYYTVWISGIIVMYILLSKVYYLPYYRFLSGYENNIGDVYLTDDNPLLTEKYFERSIENYPGNRKAGYALASIYHENEQYDDAIKKLKSVNYIEPTEFTYALLAETYRKKGEAFKDSWALEDAVKLYPEVPELWVNYAYSYFETPKLDSATRYFQKGMNMSGVEQVSQANLLAYNTLFYPERIKKEDLIKRPNAGNLAYKANKLAFFNKNNIKEPVNRQDIKSDEMDLVKSVYLNNYIVFEGKKEPGDVYAYIKDLEQENIYFSNLDLLRAWMANKNGEAGIAESVLDSLKENVALTLMPYYSNASGLIMMQSDHVKKADKYFEESSLNQRFMVLNKAPLYQAQTAMILGDTSIYSKLKKARISWPTDSLLVQEIWSSLDYSEKLSDKQKYWNLLFFRWYRGNEYLTNVINSIENKNTKARAIGSAVEVSLSLGDVSGAQQLWQLMPVGDIKDETVANLNLIYFDLLVQEGNSKVLADVIDQMTLPSYKEKYRGLYRAILLQDENPDEAESLFQRSLDNIPTDPKVPFYYGKFLYNQGELDKTYNVLVEASENFPRNIALLQFYSFVALEKGYESYAEYAVEKLSGLMTANSFSAFQDAYATKRDTLVQKDVWQ